MKPIEFRASALADLKAFPLRAFRIVYVAKFHEAVYVLHCFKKKTQKTGRADLDLARRRYAELVKELM